jgi:hypothetical protein
MGGEEAFNGLADCFWMDILVALAKGGVELNRT